MGLILSRDKLKLPGETRKFKNRRSVLGYGIWSVWQLRNDYAKAALFSSLALRRVGCPHKAPQLRNFIVPCK